MATVQPENYRQFLGSSFVDSLTDRADGAALRIGSDVWTKHEVATRLGVVHVKACGILSGIAKKLGVHSTADLYARSSPYTFAGYPAGVTTLYVMFAAFLDKDLEPETWFAKGQHEAIVSFLALKHRELVAERRTREDARRLARAAQARSHRREVRSILAANS